jgi:large subunit ribosomal protein L24
MALSRIQEDDSVVVIAGADKSDQPRKVIQVLEDRVIVEGVNLRWKHEKPSQQSPKGGRTRREFPIDISNVLLFSEKAGKGVRTRIQVKDGKKVRVGVPCGTVFE